MPGQIEHIFKKGKRKKRYTAKKSVMHVLEMFIASHFIHSILWQSSSSNLEPQTLCDKNTWCAIPKAKILNDDVQFHQFTASTPALQSKNAYKNHVQTKVSTAEIMTNSAVKFGHARNNPQEASHFPQRGTFNEGIPKIKSLFFPHKYRISH